MVNPEPKDLAEWTQTAPEPAARVIFPETDPWTMDEALAYVPPAPPLRGGKVARKH